MAAAIRPVSSSLGFSFSVWGSQLVSFPWGTFRVGVIELIYLSNECVCVCLVRACVWSIKQNQPDRNSFRRWCGVLGLLRSPRGNYFHRPPRKKESNYGEGNLVVKIPRLGNVDLVSVRRSFMVSSPDSAGGVPPARPTALPGPAAVDSLCWRIVANHVMAPLIRGSVEHTILVGRNGLHIAKTVSVNNW